MGGPQSGRFPAKPDLPRIGASPTQMIGVKVFVWPGTHIVSEAGLQFEQLRISNWPESPGIPLGWPIALLLHCLCRQGLCPPKLWLVTSERPTTLPSSVSRNAQQTTFPQIRSAESGTGSWLPTMPSCADINQVAGNLNTTQGAVCCASVWRACRQFEWPT